MQSIFLIVHNVRSSHNVGSLLRTAEGLGVEQVFLTGYTPYPSMPKDTRLPHIALKVSRDIHKTALGAEQDISWEHHDDVLDVIDGLKAEGHKIWAIEQAKNSQPLPEFKVTEKCALIVGREVEGIESEVLAECDGILEIPMFGSKESFNVVQAGAMALYHCRFLLSAIINNSNH